MRRNRRKLSHATLATVETLETRRLLSTINWINKGTAAVDTDGFNANYGANSTVARTIVQRAIDDWERVITNFNGAGGRNTLDVTINASSLAGSLALSTAANTYDALGKPSAGSFTLDNDGGGSNWYFDATPGSAAVPDDSDFTNFITPFAAERAINSGLDLYRYAARGVSVALGSANSTTLSGLATDVGDDPNSADPADRLLAVDIGLNGSTDYTLTTSGGRSLFEGGGAYGGPVHPYDLLNSARTLPSSVVRRLLISDTSAEFLRDVYNYTIVSPSLVNTFYVNLNTSLNQVTVTGDMNFNNDDTDVIDLEVAGTAMSFEVNGTDEVIEGAEFGTITVNALEANDNIDVDQVLSGKTVTINAGNANDTVHIAAQFGDIDTDLDSDVSVNGGGGTDTLLFNDAADASGADTYTITSPTVTKGGRNINHSLFETLEIEGSDQASTWNVNSTALYTLEITGGVGNETFNVGSQDYDSSIFGDITINAFLGDDALNIEDGNDAGTGDYTLTGTSFTKTAGGLLTFSSMQTLTLNGSNQASTYNVTLAFAGMPTTINAAQGNDTLDLGSAGNDLDASMASPLTFNGQNGNDILLLDDTGDAVAADTYTIDNTTFGKSTSSQLLTFATTERMDLTANGGGNSIEVDAIASGMNVTLRGGDGNDVFINPTQNIDGTIVGNVTLNGGNGTDDVVLSDESDATATEYTLTNNTFQVSAGAPASGVINYNNVETFEFTGSPHATDFEVVSTAAAVAYMLRGNSGDDDFNFSEDARNLAGLLSDVTVIGGPDNDSVTLFDDNNLALSSYYATKTEMYRVGTGKVKPTVESLLLSAGEGNSTVIIEGVAATAPLIVDGNAGSNGYIIGNGNWDTNLLNQTLIIGGAGSDVMSIDDTLDTGADTYSITASAISKPVVPGTQILYAGMEGITLDANTGANTIDVLDTSSALRVNGRAGADNINITDTLTGQHVEVDGGTQLDNVRVNIDAVGTASALLMGPQDLDVVRAFAGGTVLTQAGGANLQYVRTLTIDANGKFDLADNDMIVDYTGFSPRATVQGYVNTARNGGAFTGATGLTSSNAAAANPKNTTLGVMEANEFKSIYGAAALFDGQAIDNTAVLVKYTYYGDADFNGVVNFDDYARIDNGFSTGKTSWVNGDFDGNGSVNFDDYSLIDLAFNTQGGAQAGARRGARPGAMGIR